MDLTPGQQDALSEIINIGFGRAANALSMLVSQRVLIEAPQVEIYPVAVLESSLASLGGRDLINVHQIFRGRLAGDSMLLMDTDSASVLVDMLSGNENVEPRELDANAREALIETGNILLNAFIGSFGNLLKVHVTFTVPHLRVETLRSLMDVLTVDHRQMQYALVVKIRFRLIQGDVSGFVVIIMGIQSLETLFEVMQSEGFLD